jgi:hypothetical protein
MVANFVNRLTKTQYNILLSGIMVLSIFGVDYVTDLFLPNSKIPFGPISMLLMIVPITRIRKAGKPEEFEAYTFKRRLITITALVMLSAFAIIASDYVMLSFAK